MLNRRKTQGPVLIDGVHKAMADASTRYVTSGDEVVDYAMTRALCDTGLRRQLGDPWGRVVADNEKDHGVGGQKGPVDRRSSCNIGHL